MTLAFLPEDHLSGSQATQAAALDWLDGDLPLDARRAARAVRLGYPLAGPGHLYAVERGRVLGKVGLLRLSVRTPSGEEPVAGISDVVVDPAARGRGIAARLIEQIHASEAAQGIRWALLWTHPSWAAHRLYERIGYVDLFSPPAAARAPQEGSRSLARPYSIRRARADDARLLDELHRSATADRVGVLPRRRPFGLRFTLGWRSPKDFHVLSRAGRPVGYFGVTVDRRRTGVTEGLVLSDDHLPALLDAAETAAAGGWLTVGRSTLARDARRLLAERGFEQWESSHTVLMGRALSARATTAPLTRMTADPRFSSHAGDIF